MFQYDYKKCTDVNIDSASKIIRQYLDIKLQNLNTVLLFRIGEFYETFFEDAFIMSQECEVLLTKKDIGGGKIAPMAGIPSGSLDIYIKKLLLKKYRVSVCEQDSKEKCPETGLMRRKIVRTYSLGTLCDGEYLDSESNNFICAVLQKGKEFGFAYCDVSTGEFFITQGGLEEILTEISKINPSEILAPIKSRELKPFTVVAQEEADVDMSIVSKYSPAITLVPKSSFCNTLIKCRHPQYELGNLCANAVLTYVCETQQEYAPKLSKVEGYDIYEYLTMDENARKNLELTQSLGESKKYGSLFWAIDKTRTSMGKRLLKQWIMQPLRNIEKIQMRQNAVEELTDNDRTTPCNAESTAQKLKEELGNCYDIARLSSKISNNTIGAKDFLAIKHTLLTISNIRKILENSKSPFLNFLEQNYSTLEDFASILELTILDEPSSSLKEGGLIKEGANSELDFVKGQINAQLQWLKEYEDKECQGVKGIKIAHSRVIGYYIEIPVSHLKSVPQYYREKQSLSNCKRYGTDELQKFEEKVNLLNLKANELEYEIFIKLRHYAKELVEDIRLLAHNLAQLDVLRSFAHCAMENDFVKPNVTQGSEFEIVEGKHPSAALLCSEFVPNDLIFEQKSFVLLTGPNMVGKSTYLRQNALLSILSQMGSYIPAKHAKIGVLDKIFTRMGAVDNLINNNSTFMVEMLEIAYILENATDKSLILLDEVGKNTSTQDGVAIARAVCEYIVENLRAKTVFATHYHKLADLEEKYPQVQNLMMSENFSRKVEKGFLNKSYGVNIARQAGLPEGVIAKAVLYLN